MDRQCLFELKAFKGPSKAVKANLQTLFTDKQRALWIIPNLPKSDQTISRTFLAYSEFFLTKTYSEVNFYWDTNHVILN